MKTAIGARFLFGASAVFFGVIALMWHDADTWQALSNFWKFPAGHAIGDVLMVAQIVGGLLLLLQRPARIGAVILIVVYALFSIACIPGIVAHPSLIDYYDGFFEQFCLLSGAVAAYAATLSGSRSTVLGRASRIGLGLSTIVFTLAQVIYLKFTASLVPMWIPPSQMFWAILTTVAFGLAAIAMLANVKARLAIRLMALMIVLFGLLVWVPALVAHPQPHGNWSEFGINYQIAGAAWVVGELRAL